MRVSHVSYARTRSDHHYGNRRVELTAQVDEGEDPQAVLGQLKEMAERLVDGSDELADLPDDGPF